MALMEATIPAEIDPRAAVIGPDPTAENPDISLYDAPAENGPRQAWVRVNTAALRMRAAKFAVDMETGTFIDPDNGERWPHGQPYSMARIARVMGSSPGNTNTLSFMKGAEFQRAVEWERVRREANYRMTITDARPILRVVSSALLLEVCRRALQEPESFKNSELLDATRKYIGLLGELEGDPQKPKDIHTTVNVFLQQVRLLPEEAQEKAMGLFQHELDSLATIAQRAGRPMYADPARGLKKPKAVEAVLVPA